MSYRSNKAVSTFLLTILFQIMPCAAMADRIMCAHYSQGVDKNIVVPESGPDTPCPKLAETETVGDEDDESDSAYNAHSGLITTSPPITYNPGVETSGSGSNSSRYPQWGIQNKSDRSGPTEPK
jgi:hypothetical protein